MLSLGIWYYDAVNLNLKFYQVLHSIVTSVLQLFVCSLQILTPLIILRYKMYRHYCIIPLCRKLCQSLLIFPLKRQKRGDILLSSYLYCYFFCPPNWKRMKELYIYPYLKLIKRPLNQEWFLWNSATSRIIF